MKYLLAALLLVSGSQKVAPVTKSALVAKPVQSYTPNNVIPIDYPADCSKYTKWELQQSTDMTNWITLQTWNVQIAHRPDTTNDVYLTNSIMFWRMKGTQ